jgi:predicted Zn-dependent protease
MVIDKIYSSVLKYVAGLLCILALAACTLSSGTHLGDLQSDQLSQSAAEVEEDVIGAREHPKIISAFGGIYENRKIEAMLGRVVGKIIAASDQPGRGYQITLLNSPVVNAFALPGGYLYVTRGLLALANDESEIAAVLAHEMAHVTMNHAIKREQQARTAAVVNRVVADVLRDPTAAQAQSASSELSLASFSREQEMEADDVGIKTIARAGYDPYAASRFLKLMQIYTDLKTLPGQNQPHYLSSHPTTTQRIERAIRNARAFGAPGIGEKGRERYLEAIDRLLFGDDPSEGFVRGTQFIHPSLRLIFSVPEGFKLENTPQAILGTDPSGAAVRFDGVDVPDGLTLSDYLTSGWIEGLLPESIVTRSVNGLELAEADAQSDGWTFHIAVIRANRSAYRFIFATRNSGAIFDAVVEDTLQSFRLMSSAEAAQHKPLNIKIYRVRAGDTVEKLAERMETAVNNLTLFTVLNGLDPSSRLEPGALVKLVQD